MQLLFRPSRASTRTRTRTRVRQLLAPLMLLRATIYQSRRNRGDATPPIGTALMGMRVGLGFGDAVMGRSYHLR